MNVNDFDAQIPEGDKLEIIFQRQRELMEKYHSIEEKNLGYPVPREVLDLNNPQHQQRIKDFAWRITEEIGEAMNCLKNKPWKSSHMQTDEVHFIEELIDAFHFTVELLLMIGLTPESLTKMYLNKSEVNRFRIRSNY